MSNGSRRLSLAAFTAWLQSKHERTKVGLACEADFCPLAKFLTQTTGIPHVVAGDGYDYIAAKLDADGNVVKDLDGDIVYDEANAVELPQWAQHFVGIVDENDGSISAMKALRIAESTTLGRASRM